MQDVSRERERDARSEVKKKMEGPAPAYTTLVPPLVSSLSPVVRPGRVVAPMCLPTLPIPSVGLVYHKPPVEVAVLVALPRDLNNKKQKNKKRKTKSSEFYPNRNNTEDKFDKSRVDRA